MAHRIQRGAVRDAGRADHRRARALRAALVGIALIAGGVPSAGAQAPEGGRAPLVETTAPSFPAWWSELGRPGWSMDLPWGAGSPWSLAGHVRGAWQLDEPGSPNHPFPGVLQAQVPPSWFDTLVVTPGDPARDGYDAGWVRVAPMRLRPAPGDRAATQTVADFLFAGGSSAYDVNALWLRRGDRKTWFEAGALDWKMGGIGSLALSGRHLYGGTGGWTTGRHRLEGGFTQRGAAGALVSGEEQSVTGLSGFGGWSYALLGGELGVTYGQSYDHHESVNDDLLASRRDARAEWATAQWADSAWSVRGWARRQRVARVTELEGGTRWSNPLAWVSVDGTQRRRSASFHAGVGVGRDDATGVTAVAPTGSVTFHEGAYFARIHAGRFVTPIWSDLAAGQTPFLQSAWTAGFEAGARGMPGRDAQFGWLMGRTAGRAVASRLPLEDLWLREGVRVDPANYDFGLAWARLGWRGRHFGMGGEGFALLRDRHAVQANVDPGEGARGFVEGRFRAFADDLGIRLRAEVEVTGARESEGPTPFRLPAFATTGASVMAQLADVTVIFHVLGIEDERHRETWIDSLTGLPAVGPGREFRLSLTWRLLN